MNATYGTRSRWADKAAFIGLVIAVLVIAHMIVVSRSVFILSEPIELDCADLSVCIPIGKGWQSEKLWKYQKNTFTLDSFFSFSSPLSVTATVSCRYLLAAAQSTPEELFDEKVSAIGGSRIVKTGRVELDWSGPDFARSQQNGFSPALNWAYIQSMHGGSSGPETFFDIYYGVVQLPNNRQLNIEVYQVAGDAEFAEKIFKSVIESLKYTDNQLLEAGGKIVSEIKNRGIGSFLQYGFSDGSSLAERNRESFFLIQDANRYVIGFMVEILGSRFEDALNSESFIKPAQEGQYKITAWGFYYIRGQPGQEQATFFESDNRFNEFVWKSEMNGPGGRTGAEIILSKNSVMVVRELSYRVKEASYQISPGAIPDVLVEFTFDQMIDSNQKKIFVDIIEVDGKIKPTLVSRIEPGPLLTSQNQSSGTDITGEEAAYVFKVELMDGRGFSEQVYLDDQRQVSRRVLKQGKVYIIERTTAENILRDFPEQGGYILKNKDKILEHN